MIVTDKEVAQALKYLQDTDHSCAQAAALKSYLDSKEKTILAMTFLDSTGTVAEREARSRTGATYLEWMEQYREAVADFELQKAKRKRAELMVEVWRSCSANQRRGNI